MTARHPCPAAPGPLEEYAARSDDLFVRLAQRRGFRVYLTGLLAEALRSAGARHVIVGRDGLADTVRSATEGRGADLVFDATGGPDLPATAAASEAGTVVHFGWFDDRPTLLPTRWPMKIVGHIDFTTTQDPARLTQVRNLIAAGLRSGAFTPHIDKEFTGLDQVAAAHTSAAAGRQFGKILVAVE